MAVTIDELEIQIHDNAEQAASGLDALTATLNKLRAATHGGGGLNSTAKNLSALADSVHKIRETSGLNRLANGLKELQGIGKLNLSGTISQLEKAPAVMTGLNGVKFGLGDGETAGMKQTMDSLVRAVEPLKQIEKTNLGPTLNQLKKIPDIVEQLNPEMIEKFAAQMERVATAVRPLATEMEKVSAGFSAFPSRIQKLITQNEKLSASNQKLRKSYGVLGTGISGSTVRMGAMLSILRRVGSMMGGWINESAGYVENVNLFSMSMGKYADEAMNYANKVQDALGIDVSEWIRNQGVFKEVATGFGLVGDQAYTLSKGLTQLGYDLSSYWNVSVETAMEKLRSGMSGQVMPLREFGISLSQATLEQTALNLGIKDSVSKMSEAQKATLRYITIMEKSKNALGDMSRTVITPANAMRILQQQITQLTRALGNLFIPILIKIIPYIQAFVMALTEAINALAVLFGFELPKIDYSGIEDAGGSVGDLEDKLGGASSAAKELKGQLAGFDQINLIQSASGGGSGGGSASGMFDGIDLKAWDYDFLGDAANKAKELVDKMKELLDWIALIGAALAAWKLANILSQMGWLAKLLGSIAAIALEFHFVKKFTDDYFATGDLGELIKALIVTAIGSGFLYKLWGPAGLAIGVSVGIVAMLTSMYMNVKSGVAQMWDAKTSIVMAVASAMGGVAGIAVAKAAGINLVKGAIVGITATASLAVMIGNVAAIASGQYSAGSAESLLTGLISTVFAGLAGLAITASPAGFLIGIGVGVILNIISLQVAIQQQIKQNSIDAFFDGQGVAIDDLAGSYNNLMQRIIDANQPIIDGWASIEKGRESISGTAGKMEYLNEMMLKGGVSAEEALPQISGYFEEIYNAANTYLVDTGNIIYAALGGMSEEALLAMGYTKDQVVEAIASTQSEAQKAMKEANAEIKELIVLRKAGEIAEQEYADRFRDAANVVLEYAGITSQSTSELEQSFKDLADAARFDINFLGDIDMSDADAVSRALEGANAQFELVKEKTEAAKSSVNEYYDSVIEAVEAYKQAAKINGASSEELDMWDNIIKGFEFDRGTKLGEIDAQMTSFAATINESLVRAMGDQFSTAQDAWLSMDDVSKRLFGGSEGDYVKQALETFTTNIVAPISSGMSDAFGPEFGAGAAVQASEYLQSNLFTEFEKVKFTGGLGGWGTEKSYELAGDIEGVIKGAVGELPKFMEAATKPTGKGIVAGAVSGIQEDLSILADAGAQMGSTIKNAFDAETGFASPATEFIDRGLGIDQGLEKGILDNATLPVEAMKSVLLEVNGVFNDFDYSSGLNNMFNQMLGKTEKFANAFQDAISDMLQNVSRAVDKFDVSGAGSATISIPSVKIPRFASGGFPEDGLFFANRSELVGRFTNGKTAVANNEQITEGFKRAVQEGEAENNALMREQNELLRKLLAKETGVVISPTPDFGRVARRSIAMDAEMRGAT